MVQDYAPTPQMMQESNFGSMFSEMEQETNQVQPGIIRQRGIRIPDPPDPKKDKNPFLELVNRKQANKKQR